VLDDYASLALAALDLFEATSEPQYLEHALALAEKLSERFASPSGGFFLTSGKDQEPLGRRMILDDAVEPSGNAMTLLLLERLSALTGRENMADVAKAALHAHAARLRERPIEMAGWLDAALFASGPVYEIIVAGSNESPDTRTLIDVWKHLSPFWTVGARIDAAGPSEPLATLMPTVIGKSDRSGTALAFVCVHGACRAPIRDAARLRAALLEGWVH
jgi:uncharacterized protein YyaL (SSP411 family)